MKKPVKTSIKSPKAASKAVKAKPAKKVAKAPIKSAKKDTKVALKPSKKDALTTKKSSPKKITAKKLATSKNQPEKNNKSTTKSAKVSSPIKSAKPKIAKSENSLKARKTQKIKEEKDDLVIPVEEIKDFDVELLSEIEPKARNNKNKVIAKPKTEEEEEIKPTFAAKSLTQALVGPPPTPPKAIPISKTKSKYQKFELEFLVHSSVKLLFEFISTPSGLSEWFSDDVNFRNGVYSFFWDKSEQKARLLQIKENKSVRFQWLEDSKDIYFEFRIEVDELTGDVALIITDFAEDDESREAATLLWNSQVETLLKAIGSY